MSASDYTEAKVLDHILKIAAFTVPPNVYIALSTADPGEDGAGLAEPVGSGYARKVCNAWTATANNVRKNTAEVLFDPATGAGWGTITHFALMDAFTGGNILFKNPVDQPGGVTIDVGEAPRFQAQTLQVTAN